MTRRIVAMGAALGAVVYGCGGGSSTDQGGGLPPVTDVGAPGPVQNDPTPTSGVAGTGGGVSNVPGGTGMAGAAAEPVPTPVTDTTMDPAAAANGDCELALDECDIDSGWPGDEFCILPPPADMGFQVHVGPADYNNPESNYVLQPGQETNLYFDGGTSPPEDVYYYYRQYRLRAGSHHMIVNAGSAGGGLGNLGGGSFGSFGVGRRVGGSSNSAKDNPECGVIAPENEDVGMLVSANTPFEVNLHYFNVTGTAPVLQEAWINFWYRDPALVKEQTQEMFAMGGLGMNIQPHEHTTLGPYSCPVNTPGRVLTMYGHYHSNTVRFSAWRVRGGQRELVLEDYDWHDPLALEFSSIVDNAPADPQSLTPGGHSGILDLQAGDALEWECEVDNQTDGVLRFTNEAVTGEMCILIGDTIGPKVSCSYQ